MAANTPTEEPRERLSALMRKGFEMLGRRQNMRGWIGRVDGTEKFEACALGCAIIGFGYSPEKLNEMVNGNNKLNKLPDDIVAKEILGKTSISDATFFAPDTSQEEQLIHWVITHNDNHGWSVEKIADTLEAAGY
jgi:hypothetical protein